MNVIWFLWYLVGIFISAFVVISFITYAPGAKNLRNYEQLSLSFIAVATAGLAMLLWRLPSSHWVHCFKPLWLLWVALGIGIVGLLTLIG
jgi:hypothetical protein